MTNTNENATKKTTKRDYFTMIKPIVEASDVENKDDIISFIENEIDKLNKKRESRSNATSEINGELAEIAYEVLSESDTPMRISEMLKDSRLTSYTVDGEVKTMSSSKLTVVVGILVKTGRVVNTKEGKNSYYSVK